MSDINKFTTKEVLNKVLLDSSGNSVAANSHTSQEALNAVLDTSNNRLNVSLGGSNTISGDVTITGDLTVQGNGTGNYDEIIEGNLILTSGSKLGVGTGDASLSDIVDLKGDDPHIRFIDSSDSDKTWRVGVANNEFRIQEDGVATPVKIAESSVDNSLVIDGNGAIGIGTSSAVAKVDIVGTRALNLTDNITDNNNKNAVITSSQYASGTETEGFMLMQGFSNAAINRVDIGGGNSQHNAVEQIRFFTAANATTATGTQAMHIDNAQNIGIQTSSPATPLHVNSDGSANGIMSNQIVRITPADANNGLNIGSDGTDAMIGVTNNDTDLHFLSRTGGAYSKAMTIDGATGNVGIGGDAVTKAGTFGDATTLGLVGTDGSGNGPSIQVAVDTTADARPMSLVFFNKNNADSSGATTKHIAAIRSFTVTSDSNAGDDSGGILTFHTKPESGSFDERLRISSGGQVGIANSDPASCWSSADDLVVGSTSQTSTGITIMTTASGDGNLHFADQTGSSNQSYIRYDHNSTKMIFATENVQHLFLDGSGNVSIGTTATYGNLTVGGTGEIIAGRASSGAGSFSMYESGTTRFVIESLNGSNGMAFKVPSTTAMKLDANSRISLSNNDSGGTGGTDSTSGNTIFGYLAGNSIQDTSIDNTYIGHKSGASTTTADNNVAIGARALFSTTVAGNSVAVGELSGYSVTDHGNNVFVGQTAGFHQTGESNVFIGKDAGLGSSGDSGDDNVVIGKSASLSGASSANQTVIGKGATGQADNSVTLGNSSVANFYLAPGNTSGQTINFNDAGAGGFIQYDHSDDQMKFASANTINARLYNGRLEPGSDDTQDLGSTTRAWHTLYVKDGINFPDDASANPSSDANTLDNYEEGTWTPVLSDGTNNFTMVANNNGNYTKVGRAVHFNAEFGTGSIGSASGALLLTGLPFTSAAVSTSEGCCNFGFIRKFNYSSNAIQLSAMVNGGDTTISFFESVDDSTEITVQCSQADFAGTGFFMRISGTYFV